MAVAFNGDCYIRPKLAVLARVGESDSNAYTEERPRAPL